MTTDRRAALLWALLNEWRTEDGTIVIPPDEHARAAHEALAAADAVDPARTAGMNTRELLEAVADRMANTQNSNAGRDLGRDCRTAVEKLAKGVLDYRPAVDPVRQEVVRLREALEDLHGRLAKVRVDLHLRAGDPNEVTRDEALRLYGKSEGVALAESYMAEVLRTTKKDVVL